MIRIRMRWPSFYSVRIRRYDKRTESLINWSMRKLKWPRRKLKCPDTSIY